jgi:hypothetical protein
LIKFNKDEIEQWDNIENVDLFKKKYLFNSFQKVSTKKRKSTKQVIQYFRQNHGNRYDYSKVEYINSKTKLIIICQKHGEFQIDFHRHLKLGCTKCHNDKMALIYKKTNENFIKEFRKVHGNKYNYSKVNYINNTTKVIITCSIHGDFKQTPLSHKNGFSCKKCMIKDTHLTRKNIIKELQNLKKI